MDDKPQKLAEALMRPATVNPFMARQVEKARDTLPLANALTRYNEDFPQNWQQFGENVKQTFPTPASGGTREQILAAAQNLAMGIGPQMTVYHGSPHSFTKFDASKIGTGEGAQAYGHGLYFAESPEVAAAYRATTSNGFGLPDGNTKGIATLIAAKGADGERMARSAYKSLPPAELEAAISEAKQAVQKGSSLYKVDLPDEHIAKMLDWDKPLANQPEALKAIQKYADEIKSLGMQKEGKDILDAAQLTGMPANYFYKIAQKSFGADSLSKDLARHGIPGIRYLDGGSRAGGQGTSNFVVFPGNEGLLKILERN